MSMLDQITRAVLYEGYVLWPYRRSARKNQQRWTLGGIYPRPFAEAGGAGDRWCAQAECLAVGEAPAVEARLRFLQVVERQPARAWPDGGRELVDEVEVDGVRWLAWDEARECTVAVGPFDATASAARPCRAELIVQAGAEEEALGDGAGAVIVRRWQGLHAAIELHVERLRDGVHRVRVRVSNVTDWDGRDRTEAARYMLASAHVVLSATDGEFVSLTDPPAELRADADACVQEGLWPVLVGEAGERGTMLAAPIILYDYPQVAPESPGDHFDGTEIDELLVLNILALTDEEKSEVRASDARARNLLERTEALSFEQLGRLHGAMREFRTLRDDAWEGPDPLAALERTPPREVLIAGIPVTPGSRVRLRPRPGGDIFDMALAGRIATVEAIEQDYDERIHLAVTVDDDPGRDLGALRQPGHRFFFSPEELEPVGPGEAVPE